MRKLLSLALAALLVVATTVSAHAQSVLRDAETEALIQEMSLPLIRAAKLDPGSVRILLIGDTSINAFATQGQIVGLNAGLIEAADNANQVQGVIAHELGHVAGGDIINSDEGTRGATNISILSLVLGIAAIAAGAGDLGMGILSAGQQAALGQYLAFSRTQESEADQAGASYLGAAGISGRGSLDFFRKIMNQEYRLAISQESSYGRTHPLSGDRIAALEEVYARDPAWNKPSDPALEARFARVKAKLIGFTQSAGRTLQVYPETDQSVPARYARAYAFHKQALLDKALTEINALVKDAPDDPYFLEVKGQILLESGKAAEAIPPLRRAYQLTRSPLIASLLGHSLIATDDQANFAEARTVLRQAVVVDNENPFAWYQLGVVYERTGDEPRAALASAERLSLIGQPVRALASGRMAMQGLPTGSADWLRAQDIVMASQFALEKDKGNRSRR